MMEPGALDDIQRFGFNLYNTANNHSGDYGQEGVMATIRHLNERDMVFSGTGKNLGDASKACYLETRKGRVALISVSSTFSAASRAGGQSHQMIGRPGLNPLRSSTRYHVDPAHYEMAQELVKVTKVNAEMEFEIRNGYFNPLEPGVLPFGNAGMFILDEKNWIESIPNQEDMKRITDEIAEARKQADVVFVSFHGHETDGEDTTVPAMFLETFSRACIDAGAHAVIGHGPHELRGIEIYKGGLILYSLGNFLFETETVSLQPYDAYINRKSPWIQRWEATWITAAKTGPWATAFWRTSGELSWLPGIWRTERSPRYSCIPSPWGSTISVPTKDFPECPEARRP